MPFDLSTAQEVNPDNAESLELNKGSRFDISSAIAVQEAELKPVLEEGSWEKTAKANPQINAWYEELKTVHPEIGERDIIDFMKEGMEDEAGYNYKAAIESGIEPEIDYKSGELHWKDLDPRTGEILKGPEHPTRYIAEAEKERREKGVLEWRKAPPKTSFDIMWDRIRPFLGKHGIVKPREQEIAEAANIEAISRATGYSLKDVSDNYDVLRKMSDVTGVQRTPEMMEVAGMGFKLMIALGLIDNPIGTILGVGTFTVVSKYVDLTKFIPEEAGDTTVQLVELADFLLKIALVKKIYSASPKMAELLTKNKITKYNLPRTIRISGDQMKEMARAIDPKLTSQFEKDMIKGLGLSSREWRAAVKRGLTIEVPAEKLIHLADKPWWGKVKKIIGMKPYAKTIIERAGESKKAIALLEKPNIKIGDNVMVDERPATLIEVNGTKALIEQSGKEYIVSQDRINEALPREIKALKDMETQAISIRKIVETKKQPILDEKGKEIADTIGARYFGTPKGVERLAKKVLLKQEEKPEYDIYSPKDHARGTIMIEDWNQTPEIIKTFGEKGFNVEVTIDEPLNVFGYRGINANISLGDKINGEIQLHTKESSALKLKTDKIYRKWRDYSKEAVLRLAQENPTEYNKYRNDIKICSDLWKDYFGKVPSEIKSSISSSLKGLESVAMPTETPRAGTQEPSLKTLGISASSQRRVPSASLETKGKVRILSPKKSLSQQGIRIKEIEKMADREEKVGAAEAMLEEGGLVKGFLKGRIKAKVWEGTKIPRPYRTTSKYGLSMDEALAEVNAAGLGVEFGNESELLTYLRMWEVRETELKDIIEKNKPKFMRMKETTILKNKIQDIKRGIREGKVIAKKEVKAAQETIIKLLDTSQLEAKDKAKFIKAMKNVQTKEQFVRALPAIEERIAGLEEAESKRGAIVALRKTVKKLDLKHMRKEYRTEIEKFLKDVDVKGTSPKKLGTLAKTREFIEQNPDNSIPEKKLRELEKLEQKSVRDLTTEEITLITQGIQHAQKLMELKNRIIVAGKYRDFIKQKDRANANLDKVKRIREENPDIDTRDEPLKIGKPREILTTNLWNMELISQKLDGVDGEIIQEIYYNGVDTGVADQLAFKHQSNDYFIERLKDIRDKDDFLTWSEFFVPKKGKIKQATVDALFPKLPKIDYQSIKLPSGRKITITKGERIALYLSSLNKDNARHLLDGGFTFEKNKAGKPIKLGQEDLDTIIGLMTPEEAKVAHAMSDYFNTVQKEALNKTSMELNGWEVALEENYFPIRTNSLDIKHESLIKSGSFPHKTLEGMGMFKERTHSSEPIILEDAFSVLFNSMKKSSAYIGLANPLRSAKTLMDDADFQRKVINNFGEHYWRELKNYLKDMEDTSYESNTLEDMALDLLHKVDVGVLGMNPWVIAIQPLSYPAAFTILDVQDMHMGEPAPRELMSKYSSQLRERFAGKATREQGEISSAGGVRIFWTGKPAFSQKLMKGVGGADYQAIGRTWKSVENEVKRLHPDLKIGSDEFYKKVAERTEFVVRRTQPTFHPKDRSQLGRGKKLWQRLLMKYTSQREKNGIMLVRAKHEYDHSNKTWKDKMKFTKAVTIITVIATLGIWIRDELRDFVRGREHRRVWWKRMLTNMLNRNLGNVPITSNATDSIISKTVRGSYAGYDSSNVLGSTLQQGYNAIAGFARGMMELVTGKEYEGGAKKDEKKWKTSMTRAFDQSVSVIARFNGLNYTEAKKLIMMPWTIGRGLKGKEKKKGKFGY